MKLLAIESSCDETSASVVVKQNEIIKVLSNVTSSSLSFHKETGGIIPEKAAREQQKAILPVIIKALFNSKHLNIKNYKDDFLRAQDILKNDIDAIAITYGPGLIGSLLIGVETAKTFSFILGKPLIPVNHLLAHIYANFIDRNQKNICFPFIGLIVSGGHTDLLLFLSHDKYKWLGGTRDDAAGEAFDKIGRLLNIPYPAGEQIEKNASRVKDSRYIFKSPLLHSNDFDFSFSGLKTEAMRTINKIKPENELIKNQICFSVQKAITDVLVNKTIKAARENNVSSIVIGGGVSANQTLRIKFAQRISELKNVKFFYPELKYCVDNAAMVGCYGLFHPVFKDWKDVSVKPELYFV